MFIVIPEDFFHFEDGKNPSGIFFVVYNTHLFQCMLP